MKKPRKLLAPIIIAILGISLIVSNISCSPNERAIRARGVKLVSDVGSCSGVQVRAPSGVDYILTAGHCTVLKDSKDQIEAITEGGAHIKRRIIMEDDKSDLLLLEGIPGLEGIHMADRIWATEHVRTFTHGGGLDQYKTEGELIMGQQIQIPVPEEKECKMAKYKMVGMEDIFGAEKICVMDVWEILATARIIPGSSGGMMVDDAGQLAGIVSAGSDSLNAFVSLADIHHFMDRY